MVSAIAIINAKRVWRGASAVGVVGADPAASSHPDGTDAVLVIDGIIAHVGTTAEVMERYAAAEKDITARNSEGVSFVPYGRPRPAACRVIDCEGHRAVFPGFIDAHTHFLDGGRHVLSPALDFAGSREQFAAIIQRFIDEQYDAAEGGWIFGGGWSEAVLGGWPSRGWLDAVSATIPMVMYSKDVHSCVMNEAALRCCHIIPGGSDDGTPLLTHVEGGRIERDAATGEPTGILRDNAMNVAKTYLPPTDSFASKTAALRAASNYYLRNGFTSVFSLMSTRFADNIAEIAFLRQMEAEGGLRLRVRYGVPMDAVPGLLADFWAPVQAAVQSGARGADAFTAPYRFTCATPANGGGYCVLGAVKLFSDGSLSSMTAAMNRPYSADIRTDGDVNSDLDDDAIAAFILSKMMAAEGGKMGECQCGLLTLPRMELRAAVHTAHSNSLQVCLHAIGDRAVATVNKVLSESGAWLRGVTPGEGSNSGVVAAFSADPRSRVEHCQHVSNVPKEVARMSTANIIASMQPCHLLFDGDYVDALLGQSRKAKSYLWGTFMRSGIRVALGSDWPVAPAEVNDGLRGAVTRVPDVMSVLAAEQQQEEEEEREKGGNDNLNINKEITTTTTSTAAAALSRYHDVWTEAECIPMDAALRAYTYEGAYGAFMEEHTGTVEMGKFADLSVWSDDFLEPAAMEPLGVAGKHSRWWPRGREPAVDFTIVAGVVEYERGVSDL